MHRRSPLRASSLALVLVALACKDETPPVAGGAPSTTAAPSTTSPVDPTAGEPPPPPKPSEPSPAIDDLRAHTMTPIGAQPGFIADGAFFVALRIDGILPWLRAIPLDSSVARDLAELGAATRVDWRAEDLTRRFSLVSNPVISMTLFRPLDTDLATLRSELQRSPSVVESVSQAMAAARPKEETPPSPPPGVPVPTPIELTEVERENGRNLLAVAHGLGLHSRFAVGVTDPTPLMDYARSLAAIDTRWNDACAPLGAVVCVGENDVVLIVRSTPTEVIADFIMFAAQVTPNSAVARALLPKITAVPADGLDHGLMGHAAVEIDAAAILRIGMVDAARRALSTVRWSDSDRVSSIKETFDEATLFAELAAAPTMFSGATLALSVAGDDVFAEGKWRIVPGQEKLAREAFETASSDAMVPTRGPLCDGSVFCFRSSGLPRPTTLGTRLGQGHYAGGFDALERRLNRLEELWAMHVIAAGWPNVMGAIAREPALATGGGPAASLVSNLVDAIGRTMGAGGSVRRAEIINGRLSTDYAMYLRATAADAAIPRALLALLGEPMSDVTLANGLGTAAMLRIPEDVPPMVLMTRADPVAPGATIQGPSLGWVAMVDSPDRLAWVLGLPMEKRGGPAAYAELPDLGRVLTLLAPIFGDFEYLRGWAERRALRVAIELVDGVPVIRAELVRGK